VSDRGYRGYIGSRPVRGTTYPQRVQNLVVRDYAQRRGLPYRLSLVEYAMPACYMMLDALLDDVANLDGIIIFSAFMLPAQPASRARIYARLFDGGATLHAALESRVVHNAGDVARFEELLDVAAAVPRAPFAGRYEKDGKPVVPSDITERTLLALAYPASRTRPTAT
jgi:sporadic carbohydrate cluster protein (TIGR04323 family)